MPSSRGGNEGGNPGGTAKQKEQKGTDKDVAAAMRWQPRLREAPGRGGVWAELVFQATRRSRPCKVNIQREALAELTYQPLQCEEAAPALDHCPDLPFSCLKTDGFVYFQWELRNLYEIREPL